MIGRDEKPIPSVGSVRVVSRVGKLEFLAENKEQGGPLMSGEGLRAALRRGPPGTSPI